LLNSKFLYSFYAEVQDSAYHKFFENHSVALGSRRNFLKREFIGFQGFCEFYRFSITQSGESNNHPLRNREGKTGSERHFELPKAEPRVRRAIPQIGEPNNLKIRLNI
jgi:hypothetical protein